MSKKSMIKIELQIRQYELSVYMLQAQLGYLKDKYPLQHAEAFLHALRVNDDKITEIKTLLDKLEKDETVHIVKGNGWCRYYTNEGWSEE